ncbi:MAG: SCP2 sterol-binding domain-containing protein [Candidatus Lokiarchaeota archaeon]|nr:SCP2 sterol-binding domain-containing protein [Candidatus Lokiarchaeota archaeon]
MIEIEKADDLLGISLNNILSFRKNEEDFIKLVTNWNKKIIIEIEKFYPVEVIFEENEIKFKIENIDNKVDLKVRMSLDTLLDIAYGRINPINAVLKSKVKMKGMIKFGTVIKFLKIFVNSMKMVASQPNQNYYELNKETR